MTKLNKRPEGYCTADEIAFVLNIKRQFIYNAWKYHKFQRFQVDDIRGGLGGGRPLLLYPIDLIKKIHELQLKGFTHKQIKAVLKDKKQFNSMDIKLKIAVSTLKEIARQKPSAHTLKTINKAKQALIAIDEAV